MFGRDPRRHDDWLVWSLLRRNAEKDPDAIAVVDRSGATSFRDLLTRSEAFAAALVASGIKAGDTISYQLPNCVEAMVVALGAMRVGAVANPIVPIYRQREVGFIMREGQTRILVVPAATRSIDYVDLALQVAPPSLDLIVTCGPVQTNAVSFEEFAGRGDPAKEIPGPSPDDDAFLIYTSGTVAEPKGVRHSQRTLMIDALSIAETTHVTAADVCFLASPITHITGLLYSHFLPQIHGNRLCLVDAWRPGEVAALIEREGCTWTTGATPFLQGLVYDPAVAAHDISSLRVFRCGGADVPPKLIRDAHAAGIRAFRSYGSSEHPTVSGFLDDDPEKAATTDGRVHGHVQLRILDIDTREPMRPGQVGEIQTRGPEQFLGYRNAALDSDAFTADGWLRTGDLGMLDEAGFLTVVGRLKDIIIRKGENISAKEVEDVLMEHAALDKVAVIGLPDEDRGEIVVAVCVIRPGKAFSMQDMTSHLDRIGLAKQKYPERIEIRDSLPSTPSGKIRKSELRQMYS